jgi:hypothetical protein
VLNSGEMATMLGFECHRQLLGCAASQCELERASALTSTGCA